RQAPPRGFSCVGFSCSDLQVATSPAKRCRTRAGLGWSISSRPPKKDAVDRESQGHDRRPQRGLARPACGEEEKDQGDAPEKEDRRQGEERSRVAGGRRPPAEAEEPGRGEAQEGHGGEDEVGDDGV